MEKKINYKGNNYTIQIIWGGSGYFARVVNQSGYFPLPMDILNDIGKIKMLMITAIEDDKKEHDLSTIEKWDGNL
jgi:hypothetical protein